MDPDKRVLTGIKPLPWSYQQIGISHLWRMPYSSIFFSFKNHTTNAFDIIKLNRLIFVPKCIITAFKKKKFTLCQSVFLGPLQGLIKTERDSV